MERLTLHLSTSDDRESATGDRVLTKLGPWGGSAAVHGCVLLLLLLWTIPIIQQASLNLTLFTGVDEQNVEELTFSLENTENAVPDMETEMPVAPVDFTIAQPVLDDPAEPHLESDAVAEQDRADAQEFPTPAIATQRLVRGGSVSDADSIEDAVDKITGGIRGRLDGGDVLVVWLLDSSLSLKDDRRRVAMRLQTFLEDIEAGDDQRDHKLFNAVVAFGKGLNERVSPTKSIDPVLHSIKTTPSDDSGVENVFAAVEKTISRYRRKWKSQMMIVIWTDESGDDVRRLSKTIESCHKGKVAVSVVGPSAVLGAETGFHAYTDPKTKMTYQLPVKRGPDSASPERIRLNYWFRGPPPVNVWIGRGRRSGFPSWYGGNDLAGITSGFSPYALTRLATSTGGSYTIFDRPEDRAPFDFERMLDYLPSYATSSDYRQDLETHAIRNAVHEAVKVTYASKLETPDLMFFGQPTSEPPFRLSPLYFTPAQFSSKLRSSRRRIERQAKHYTGAIENALRKISKDGDLSIGMNYQYEHENSARWRAWYDLTRGRLLANRVRVEEYRRTMDSVLQRGYLNAGTNGLILKPSTRMSSSDEFQNYAEEARQLLMRCLDENPDTPWAYLAQRELEYGLGIEARQLVLQPAGEIQKRNGPRLPKF